MKEFLDDLRLVAVLVLFIAYLPFYYIGMVIHDLLEMIAPNDEDR